MKKFFRLRSFQNILPWLFLLGIILGAMIASHEANIVKFKMANFLLVFMVPLFFTLRGIYKNSRLFLNDLKSINTNP